MRVEYRTDAETERRWVRELIDEWVRGKRHPGAVRGGRVQLPTAAEAGDKLVGSDGLPSDP